MGLRPTREDRAGDEIDGHMGSYLALRPEVSQIVFPPAGVRRF